MDVKTIANALVDWLFPPKCPFCQTVGDRADICPSCKKDLPWHEPVRQDLGKLPCAAPLRYEGLVRQSIHRFKFRGASYLAEPMGQLMAQCVVEAYPDGFDVVSWAPVSKKRLRKRGYDQSYLLAKALCAQWDSLPVPLLRKHTHTVAQSSLDDAAARRGNVLGVYETLPEVSLVGKRVLLVDDIATTGSTLGECARILDLAGAKDVMCVVLAKTQRETKN